MIHIVNSEMTAMVALGENTRISVTRSPRTDSHDRYYVDVDNTVDGKLALRLFTSEVKDISETISKAVIQKVLNKIDNRSGNSGDSYILMSTVLQEHQA